MPAPAATNHRARMYRRQSWKKMSAEKVLAPADPVVAHAQQQHEERVARRAAPVMLAKIKIRNGARQSRVADAVVSIERGIHPSHSPARQQRQPKQSRHKPSGE